MMKFDYRSGLENSKTLILSYISEDLTVQEVSEGIRHVLGYEPEEMINCFYATFPVGTIYDREHKNGELVTCQAIASYPTEDGHFMLETVLRAEDFKDNKELLTQQSSLLRSIMDDKVAAEVRAKAEIEFTSFLAHEVRNPLSGIDSSSQLIIHSMSELKANAADSRVRDISDDLDQAISDAHHSLNCVKYMQTILSNTLDLTKLEAGKLRLQTVEMFLFKDIISPSMTMLVSQKSDRVEVEVDCSPAYKIRSDLFRFSQVLANVLSNAFRFTKKGKVAVRARLVEGPLNPDKALSLMASSQELSNPFKRKAVNEKWLRLSIEDTGPHNAEMALKDITKYSRRRYERQASSVGLSLAYKLIEALRGDMYFDPEYTTGCAIVIELPHCYEAREEDLLTREATMYETQWVSLVVGQSAVRTSGETLAGAAVDFTAEGNDPSASIMKYLRILVVDDSKVGKAILSSLHSHLFIIYFKTSFLWKYC